MSEEQDVYDKDGVKINVKKDKKVSKKIRSVTPIICTAAFLAVGLFVPDSWKYAWLIFLLIPLEEILISALNSTVKRRVVLITTLIVIIAYIGLSILLTINGVNLAWLKLLIIFFIIPIVSIIIE